MYCTSLKAEGSHRRLIKETDVKMPRDRFMADEKRESVSIESSIFVLEEMSLIYMCDTCVYSAPSREEGILKTLTGDTIAFWCSVPTFSSVPERRNYGPPEVARTSHLLSTKVTKNNL